jgi:hypothetical protein
LIELCDSATNLAGAEPYDGIFVGVVIGCTVEDLDSQSPFFEVRNLARKRLFDHITQKSGIAPAVPKRRAHQNPLELLLNLQTVMFGDWIPRPVSCSKSHHGRAKNSADLARTDVTTHRPFVTSSNPSF